MMDVYIDMRNVCYEALVAVVKGYIDGRISLRELRAFQTGLTYNAHKQEQKFGAHALFKLDDEIEFDYAEMCVRDCFIHKAGYEPYKSGEANIWFRDKMRKAIGYDSMNITSTANNVGVSI